MLRVHISSVLYCEHVTNVAAGTMIINVTTPNSVQPPHIFIHNKSNVIDQNSLLCANCIFIDAAHPPEFANTRIQDIEGLQSTFIENLDKAHKDLTLKPPGRKHFE